MYDYDSSSTSLFQIVRLFGDTLQQLLTIPELALFLGMAVLLIIVGILSWTIRRGKRL